MRARRRVGRMLAPSASRPGAVGVRAPGLLLSSTGADFVTCFPDTDALASSASPAGTGVRGRDRCPALRPLLLGGQGGLGGPCFHGQSEQRQEIHVQQLTALR